MGESIQATCLMPVSEGDTIMVDLWIEEKEARLLESAAAGLAPPDECTVSEWAERSIYISHRVSSRPGDLRLEPYQRAPLDAIKDSERVVLIWAAQTGKTICLQCFLGWCIDQYPGPAMVVCPDQPFAKRRSTKHLRPFIEDSDVLSAHLPGERHDLQVHEYTLDTMSVTIAWAGSPSQMAGEPIMVLGRDEFDKYRDATEKESNAFRLVGRRTSSFGRLRKIWDCTTPTVETADGWKELLGGTYERIYVPCPHCAKASEPFTDDKRNKGWQILTIEQFRYPPRGKEGDEPEELCDWQARIRAEACYVCEDCGNEIPESQRWRMVCKGEWIPTNPNAPYRSFHLPSWYARTPVNSFGEVAARYVEGLEDPEAARDFANNDASEPYRDLGHNAKAELIAAHCSDDYELGTVPTNRPCILIATADLHNLVHYCCVWALTPERTYLVDCLKLQSIEAISALHGKLYPRLDRAELPVQLVFPDGQYRTTEVYEMAVENDQIIPITGTAKGGVVSWSKPTHYPTSDRVLDHPIDVLNCRDDYFKEQLLRHFESGVSEEGFDITATDWVLPRDVPREYLRHMLGEILVESKNSKGFPSKEFRYVGPNHYMDNAKYALAARYVLAENIKKLVEDLSQAQHNPQHAEPEVYGQKPEGW